MNENNSIAEQMRLNTDTAPVPASQQYNLGVIRGDNAGYPNGRRPGDDVVDISLRVMMGVLCHQGLGVCDPEDAPSGLLPFTDQVRQDASLFDQAFPYLRSPIPGSSGSSTVGLPAATLGRTFMGTLPDGSTASTEVLVTNRGLTPCDVEAIFHQGVTIPDTKITINGEEREEPSLEITILSGGVGKFEFTSDELIVGATSIFASGNGCGPDLVAVSGTYFISSGSVLNEAFTIGSNGVEDWLMEDSCVAISTVQDPKGESGRRQELGVAITPVMPGEAVPPDTTAWSWTYLTATAIR